MKNLIIKRVVQVKLYLTAEQWQLHDPKSFEINAIAQVLNRNIEDYVNRGETREITVLFTQRLMASMKEHGAFDPLPLAVLESIMNEIYGEKE
jgi:hypothetical protein